MATEATQSIEAVLGSGGGKGGGAGDNGYDGGGGLFGSSDGVPQRAYVTGMTMGLGAVLMFFMALVSAYVVRKGMPNSGWIALPQVPRILWLNTLILIASSAALARSRSQFRAGEERGFKRWWSAATLLGLLFLAGQIVAWRQLAESGVYLTTNASSSFFYLFTAAHGLHLAGGVVALAWVRVRPGQRLARDTATEVAAMYWHFMDAVWLFLFALLVLSP